MCPSRATKPRARRSGSAVPECGVSARDRGEFARCDSRGGDSGVTIGAGEPHPQRSRAPVHSYSFAASSMRRKAASTACRPLGPSWRRASGSSRRGSAPRRHSPGLGSRLRLSCNSTSVRITSSTDPGLAEEVFNSIDLHSNTVMNRPQPCASVVVACRMIAR